jgi:hypothetical protein
VKFADYAGLGKELVPTLEQGAQHLQEMIDAAPKISEETIQTAKEFDRAWNEATVKTKAYIYAWVMDNLPMIDRLIEKAKEFGPAFINSLLPKMPQLTIDENSLLGGVKLVFDIVRQSFAEQFPVFGNWLSSAFTEAVNNALASAGLSLNREAGSPGEGFADLRAEAADIERIITDTLKMAASVKIPGSAGTTKDKKKDVDDDEAANAYSRASDQIKKLTADRDAETASVGLNTEAKARNKATADLLSAAERADKDVTPELRREIDELAAAYGRSSLAAAAAKQKFGELQQAVQFGGGELITFLDALRTRSQSLQQIVQNLANTLITAIEKAALLGQGPLAGILGTAAAPGTAATGGLLGALFGGARAGGGDVEAGKAYLVGEKGPEIAVMGANGVVVPNNVVAANSSSAQHNTFVVNMAAPGPGVDPGMMQQMARQMRAQFDDMVSSAMLRQGRVGGILNPV